MQAVSSECNNFQQIGILVNLTSIAINQLIGIKYSS